jgi:hypothetical protein
MKTIFFDSASKVHWIALISLAWTSSLPVEATFAQANALAIQPAVPVQVSATEFSVTSSGFRAAAFPVANTMQVKVVAESPLGAGVIILIHNQDGQEVCRKAFRGPSLYAGLFDFSQMPNGTYTVKVNALNKAGFVKHQYRQTFRLGSLVDRTLTTYDEGREKELFRKRSVEERRKYLLFSVHQRVMGSRL